MNIERLKLCRDIGVHYPTLKIIYREERIEISTLVQKKDEDIFYLIPYINYYKPVLRDLSVMIDRTKDTCDLIKEQYIIEPKEEITNIQYYDTKMYRQVF